MPATFDGNNLVITLPSNLGTGQQIIDAKVDLYSDWKEWVLGSAQRQGFPPAFRVSGGDTIDAVTGLKAGAYYFLRNDLGWRIRPFEEDGTIILRDNLVAENSTLPILIPTIGFWTVLVSGLQPITQIAPGAGGGSSPWSTLEKDQVVTDTAAIAAKLPIDGNPMSSDQQVANATGLFQAAQVTQLQGIFDKLPIDGGDIASGADVDNLVGAGMSAGQIVQLQAIFDKLPLTGDIASDDNVLALVGQGLTPTESANLLAIFNKLPLDNLPGLATVNALIGQGLTAGQISQLADIHAKLPVTGQISSDENVTALIGQGLTAGEASQLLGIFNKLPADGAELAGANDVVSATLDPTQSSQLQSIFDKLPSGAEIIASDADVIASGWTPTQKTTIMSEVNTAMTDGQVTQRQAIKAANHTEPAS